MPGSRSNLSPDPDITRLLHQWRAGDQEALPALLVEVYADLRQLAAHELGIHRGHASLQPTALLHDVFVRLLGAAALRLENRKHLYATAARMMRQVLVDHARARNSQKRGGDWQRQDWIEALALPLEADQDLADLDTALSALAALDPRMAEIIELRFFVGLEVREVACLLAVDERTVYRDYAMARAWLRQRLSADNP